MLNKLFWKNKRVFITGHTGFKGSWMSLWLHNMQATVKGYALQPKSSKNLYNFLKLDELIESDINDIRDYKSLSKSISAFNPEIIIHMAAQPLVKESYINPVDTYTTNVIGTVNIFDISRNISSLRTILNITTDKCYLNEEHGVPFTEDDKLGGFDPYSSSKACSELVTLAYEKSFYKDINIGIATARAGNVIGGGDWAKDRLVPDILKAFDNKKNILLRNPASTRPWQHVLEPLNGYLILIEKLYNNRDKFNGPWNFGPNQKDFLTVEDIANRLSNLLNGPSILFDKQDKEFYESNILALDISKAKDILNWSPKLNIDKCIKMIAEWHIDFHNNKNIRELCSRQITEFEEI